MPVHLNRRALREHIARKNLSQNGFALKAGISSGYIAQLLDGKRRPSGHIREKLLMATGMTFDDLFILEFPEELEPVSAVNV